MSADVSELARRSVMNLWEIETHLDEDSSQTWEHVLFFQACRDLGYPNISNMNYTPLRQTILDMAAVYSEEGNE